MPKLHFMRGQRRSEEMASTRDEPISLLAFFAAELAQQNVDLLVSAAGIAAVACHLATTTIPIVSINVPDPVGRNWWPALIGPAET